MCYRNVNEGDTLMKAPQGEFDREDCGGASVPGGRERGENRPTTFSGLTVQ